MFVRALPSDIPEANEIVAVAICPLWSKKL